MRLDMKEIIRKQKSSANLFKGGKKNAKPLTKWLLLKDQVQLQSLD